MTAETIQQMPRSEKLKLMESLWEDLSRTDGEFESPAWHEKALAETERRLAAGQEQVLDWNTAKQALRSQFQ
jgi:hypothetical protein